MKNDTTANETLLIINQALLDVGAEVWRAMSLHERMHTAHEAYAVILEELDEFWEECRKRRAQRDKDNMRVELVQIAAMAIRAIHDLGLSSQIQRTDQGCVSHG